MKIDPLTFEFAGYNLEKAGYKDVILVQGDGALGYPVKAPYDRICFTAACHGIPPPLIEQLAPGERLIGPVIEEGVQNFVLLVKSEQGMVRSVVCQVLYVPSQGAYGIPEVEIP